MKHFLSFHLFIWLAFFSVHSQVMITELADPADNDSQGRFVELYNYSSGTVDLTDWSLTSWTGSSGGTSTRDLSGSLDAGAFYIIAGSISGFTTVYGQSPDITGASVASRNGDDGFILFNGNTIVDAYGTFSENNGVFTYDNGDDTCWEYSDGRAYRKVTVTSANPNFDDSEWVVFNNLDSGIITCTDYFSGPEHEKNVADMGPFVLGETLSIHENPLFTITPNPVSEGNVYLKGLAKPVKVSLYNLSGQLIQEQITSELLDVRGLSIGLYLVRIHHPRWILTRKLVIK
jgi:hypothetical protein